MLNGKVKVIMLNVLWKGLDLSNNVCEYEVNQLTNEKVIRGKRNFNANCLRRQTPARAELHQSISRNFVRKIRLIIKKN